MPIIHLDMDYFFGACEELRHPEFKGRPLVVGTSPEKDKNRGVVQTCNYEARAFGIRSGMPTAQAFKLHADLVYLQEDYEYYDGMSRKVHDLLREYNFPIEQMSIDEFAIDLGSMGYEEAERLSGEIKGRIRKELGLPCTIGISCGKVFAKMVCDDAKPDGLKTVREDEVREFLGEKGVGKLPGIGKKTEERLHEIGIEKIGDIAKANVIELMDRFGIFGKEMYELANGIDESKVIEKYDVLSIGREATLDEPTRDAVKINSKLSELAHTVKEEVDKKGFTFKTIGVKVRFQDFTEKVKSRSLQNYSNSEELMYRMAVDMIAALIGSKEEYVRKVGVRVSSFSGGKGQKRLF